MKMLQAFREAAKSRNLCDKYSEMWDNCKSKKQLFDLATDSNGIPYICESMVEGWGLTPDFIKAAEKIKKGQESMIKAMYNIDE